jgi:hypothetical protein
MRKDRIATVGADPSPHCITQLNLSKGLLYNSLKDKKYFCYLANIADEKSSPS